MIGFFIKKSFFDGWDNFLSLLVQNLVCTVLSLGVLAVISYVQNTALIILLLTILLFIFSIHQAGSYSLVKENANYRRGSYSNYKKAIKKKFKHSLLYFVIFFLVSLCAILVIPFYFKMQNLIGYLIAMFIFWAIIIVLLAMMYYFPLAFLMEDDKPKKTLKKSFLVLGDNFGISLFVMLWGIIAGIISVILAFLIPGMGGVNLNNTVAMKLLMFKYDYLEENPNENPKEINWEDLLFDEKEKVGNRSLKNMIFPWKD